MATAQGHENPGWYVRDPATGEGRHLWYIAGNRATRADVTHPSGGAGTYFTARPGETMWQALRRMTTWLDGLDDPGPFHRIILDPGRYHPRMARPLAPAEGQTLCLPDRANEHRHVTGAQNQLASLIDDLRSICRVVQPSPATLAVYGHEIRNLLILAATEVEMHWRGILVANDRTAKGGTAQYIELAGPLRLRDFAVRFHPFPEIDPVTPFAGWNSKEPTKSLRWYAAYNGVKHNREFEFDRASLGHAFDTVAACAVMLVAQFGEEALTPELSSFLSVEAPDWPIEEMYIPPQDGDDWAPIPCPSLS